MKKLLLFTLLFFPSFINSQNAGDIAFIQYNADGTDNFAFVCLTDFNSGDKIYFTENEPDDIEGGEWECEWVVNSTITKGTIITISKTDGDGTLGNATIDKKGDLGLSSSGDGIWAYTGSDFGQTTTWIAAIGNNGSSNTWDATEGLISSTTLTNGTNAVALAEIDNAKYDGSTTTGTKENLLSAINNYNNWTGSNSTNQTFTGTFNVTSSSSSITYSANTTISSDLTYDNVTINNGITLTVAKNGSLTVSTSITNNGTIIVESDSVEYGSIIYKGANDDITITYKRFVSDEGTNEWDLIGSPVYGQSISSFVSSNSSLADQSPQYAIGVFSNDGGTDTAAAMYTNYTSDGTGAGNISSAGNFTSGVGYAMATDEADSPGTTLDFTGTIYYSDRSVSIDDQTSTLTNYGKFNLVANPYPSYIALNDGASSASAATENFIRKNSIDNNYLHDTYSSVYGYDGDGSFTPYNNTGTYYIAPGQAFFVASDDPGGATIKFTEAMQNISGSDDFILNDPIEEKEVLIKLFNGDNEIESTKLYFGEGLNLGLDRGYDAGNFHAEAPLMTRLVEDDEGYGMSINAMGLDAMENTVIPLVINQSAGQEFRVNLFTATIPDPNVYLEDIEEGTFTNLLEGDFIYTPTSDLNGVGRFFIHMSADTMSNEEVSTSMLNAYKEIDANYITVEGLATQLNETKVNLYNILGREVLSTTLNNNMGTQKISTIEISTGIYVIKLESGSDRLTKKLIIQ